MRRSDAKPPDVYNMGFRQACGRVAYGALNRRLSPAEAQRSPFHATLIQAHVLSSPSRDQRRRPGLASLFLTKDTRWELVVMERVLCICGQRPHGRWTENTPLQAFGTFLRHHTSWHDIRSV